jgi:flagellar secretion chaperone FliS
MNIRQSYREGTVRGASPVDLVIRLNEQMIEDLRRVSEAIEKNDIVLRTNRIKHAILVVGCLQSSLDYERGGKVAQNLDYFYNVLREKLFQVQCRSTQQGVAQLITDLLAVREAWIEVERAERASLTAGDLRFRSDPDADSDRPRLDWQG